MTRSSPTRKSELTCSQTEHPEGRTPRAIIIEKSRHYSRICHHANRTWPSSCPRRTPTLAGKLRSISWVVFKTSFRIKMNQMPRARHLTWRLRASLLTKTWRPWAEFLESYRTGAMNNKICLLNGLKVARAKEWQWPCPTGSASSRASSKTHCSMETNVAL